ncbi:MAG TPA: methyltransferase domain-containing protein, partial [Pyrinomonadaceae bacterium]|nr:methyltransferase domain-containing protein [Pyrinomonadaceae bacterium]
MTSRVDLFDSTYSNFSQQVLQTIRGQTFGRDIGQNSWLTADEYDKFISWLRLLPGDHALEVASGSGGPARYLAQVANCHVTGIDANEHGVKTANEGAAQARTRVTFQVADANTSLP